MTSPTETILAIDPGPEMSAWVSMYGRQVMVFAFEPNSAVLDMIRDGYEADTEHDSQFLVIEDVKCYGRPVGASVFEMCKWMGRFQEANGGQAEYINNRAIRQQICNSGKAKDPHIRQALIDRYGGEQTAIGNKKHPGPLYGMKQNKHHWSALAVGVTFLETRKQEPPDAE